MWAWLGAVLQNDWAQNGIAVLVVVALLWAIVRAGREPLWAEAYRRLRRNRVAMISLAVVSLYGIIAVADSIGWRDDKNAPRKTIIDRVFERPQERYYSYPLAATTFGEPKPRPLLAPGKHLLGTDSVGDDIFYRTLKGCRTALIIGGFTSLLVTPLALLFGLRAGDFGKRVVDVIPSVSPVVDYVIEFVYTLQASSPEILLLNALLLVLGPGLLNLCLALGITSWVGLCRLTRGETLKHRDREYVRAARALGASHSRILLRHILPNLMPVVIISVTLSFSGLVLSEAILSYLGIGVEPGVGSWGNMIDSARLELAREPIIWWNLASASTALFILVLAFNIFGDALRDAIDPRLRSS